jgi:putative oxidoreductase
MSQLSRSNSRAERFDLTDGWNVLRIATGAFFFPHVAGKFVDSGINPGVLAFFEAAGLTPAHFFVALAALLEATVGIALVMGLFTRYAALAGMLILLTAAYALHTVMGFKGWVWNSGGYEYPVFWAFACLAVSLEGFRRRRQAVPVSMVETTT